MRQHEKNGAQKKQAVHFMHFGKGITPEFLHLYMTGRWRGRAIFRREANLLKGHRK